MASVPAIIDKGSSYIMESLGFSLRSERWKARELGHWKWRKKRGIGEEGPLFLFALFFLSLSRGFFAPALKAIEFAQYSFTVHNKVVVYLVFLRKLTRSFAEKFFLYVMSF